MNAFLLGAVLVAQGVTIAVLLWIVNILSGFADFSKEDQQVKEAHNNLPPQN